MHQRILVAGWGEILIGIEVIINSFPIVAPSLVGSLTRSILTLIWVMLTPIVHLPARWNSLIFSDLVSQWVLLPDSVTVALKDWCSVQGQAVGWMTRSSDWKITIAFHSLWSCKRYCQSMYCTRDVLQIRWQTPRCSFSNLFMIMENKMTGSSLWPCSTSAIFCAFNTCLDMSICVQESANFFVQAA